MAVVPEMLWGQRDVNKEQSLDSQSHRDRGGFRRESAPGLFSETLERSRSRRGMQIVNTALRRRAEEDPLSTLCFLSTDRRRRPERHVVCNTNYMSLTTHQMQRLIFQVCVATTAILMPFSALSTQFTVRIKFSA